MMTLRLTRGLWLWAAVLALALLVVIPSAGWLRAVLAWAIVMGATWAWMRAGRRFVRQRQRLVLAEGVSLPPADYRQPVVLVCGDGLEGLFGEVPADRLAVRTTLHGCYVRVPTLVELMTVTAGLRAVRPDWGGQLSVMFVANPDEHSDAAELAGQASVFCHQLSRVRQRGVALPLILTSYMQVNTSAEAWFSWAAGETCPRVHERGTCTTLLEWQRQASDTGTGAKRLCSSVQLDCAATWLKETLLARFASHEVLPLACAITQVPAKSQTVANHLWAQWVRDKAGLIGAAPVVDEGLRTLPFPDPVLDLLPLTARSSARLRAGVLAWWMFAVAGSVALASSAWQNNLLLRQISDDLRRYSAIPLPERREHSQFALREAALTVLREDAVRLDHYYRQGEPLALGMGLYRGELLRMPLLATIAGHRQPLQSAGPVKTPGPVRLDSLSLFGAGSAELKPGSTKVLINALAHIKAQPGWLVVIAGHTDATGNAAQNLELSRRRAASVRDWMQRMGDIPDSCFAVQGFGASQPLASNQTEVGRAANRRVDIRLVPEEGACAVPSAAADTNTLSHSAAVQS